MCVCGGGGGGYLCVFVPTQARTHVFRYTCTDASNLGPKVGQMRIHSSDDNLLYKQLWYKNQSCSFNHAWLTLMRDVSYNNTEMHVCGHFNPFLHKNAFDNVISCFSATSLYIPVYLVLKSQMETPWLPKLNWIVWSTWRIPRQLW